MQISFEQPHFRRLFLDADDEEEEEEEKGEEKELEEGGIKKKKKKKKKYDWKGRDRAFGPPGGLQFFFYERRRRGRGRGGGGDGEETEEIEEDDDDDGDGTYDPSRSVPYVPGESPMHDHMDDEDFLLRTSL